MKLMILNVICFFSLAVIALSFGAPDIKANSVPDICITVKNIYGTGLSGLSADLVDNAKGGCLNKAVCADGDDCPPECRVPEQYWYSQVYGPRVTDSNGFLCFNGGSRNGILGCGESPLGIRFPAETLYPGSINYEGYYEAGGITDAGAAVQNIEVLGITSSQNVNLQVNNGQNNIYVNYVYLSPTPPPTDTPTITPITATATTPTFSPTPTPTTLTGINPPTNLAASCVLKGTSATVSWLEPTGGADGYKIRIDKSPESWNSACPKTNNGDDFCPPALPKNPTSYTFTSIAGASYKAYIQSLKGTETSNEVSISFTCQTEDTSTPWINTTGGDVHSNQ